MTDLYDAMGTQLAERARCLAVEHGPFASPHEAYGVLAEEVAELLDEVRRRAHNGVRLRDEALDIAAAALRYAVQLEAAWEAREPSQYARRDRAFQSAFHRERKTDD